MHQCKKYSTREVMQLLKDKKIAVYGTGFTASRVVLWMQGQGIQENISCFIMTVPDKKTYMGKAVVDVSAYRAECGFLCIAVHEAILDEITGRLHGLGVTDYLWITPYMEELEVGIVEKRRKLIKTEDIMHMHEHDYMVAVRYMAVLEFYGKISFGYDTYLKGVGLFSGSETCKARLKQFIQLMENWEKNGYDAHSVISVDRDNHIINGSHRFSLAQYHGFEEIECMQYETVLHRTGEMWDRAFIRENMLEHMCLEDYAVHAVKKIQEYLLCR